MKIFLLSPYGVPMNQVLFPTFIKTFEDEGHSFVEDISLAEIIFFDLHSRICGYKDEAIDYLTQCNLPIVSFDEWDRGHLGKELWPHPLTEQQQKIFNHIERSNIKAVHFCRLLDKTKSYPSNLHPYEKPISYEEPILNADQLFNREFDVCFIANQSESRDAIAKAFLDDGRLKCLISIGATKIPFNDFISQNKRSKLFVSSGAGGYSNERPQCLFSISAMIQERNDQLVADEFTHLKNCIRIDSPPTKKDLDIIVEIVNNKEKLYDIYTAGIDHMKKYYSEHYMASRVLNLIQKQIYERH